MRSFYLLVFLVLSGLSYGQKSHVAPENFNKEQKNVLRVVLNVFEAMRKSDSTLLASCFVENPDMYTAFTDRNGKAKLHKGNFRGFKNAVASEKDQVWDEPVWDLKVDIDGDMAMAWMSYAFYLGNEMLHCGVDVMLLHRENQQWKIYHISDTRTTEGCDVPESLKKQ